MKNYMEITTYERDANGDRRIQIRLVRADGLVCLDMSIKQSVLGVLDRAEKLVYEYADEIGFEFHPLFDTEYLLGGRFKTIKEMFNQGYRPAEIISKLVEDGYQLSLAEIEVSDFVEEAMTAGYGDPEGYAR